MIRVILEKSFLTRVIIPVVMVLALIVVMAYLIKYMQEDEQEEEQNPYGDILQEKDHSRSLVDDGCLFEDLDVSLWGS